ALPIDNIERIEVLRGPQSTLYGSDALAGVINIISKKGNGAPKFSLLTEGGSYNSYKAQLGINGSLQKLNYSVALSRTGSDGFSVASEKYGNNEKDGYNFNNASALIGYSFSENSELNLYTRFLKSESDNDQFGGEFGDDPTYLTNQEEFSIRGEGKVKLFDGLWNQKIGLSFLRNVRNNSYDTSSASLNYPFYVNDYSWSHYDGRKYKIDWQNDFQLSKSNVLTAGLEFEIEESASEYYAFNYVPDPFSPDIASVIPMQDASTFGLFVQDQLKLEEGFYISLGARLDDHSKFGSQFTYKIAPAFMLWETNTKFKVTIGTGFKAPSLYYLYDPAFGNENLNPEESFGWDFGIEQYLFAQNLSIGTTFFYNKFS
ncbi:MAG: TonB-dependent receptor, partial [Ignavibacterium sp.]|nr:TonB-dependent receptor [Ignavibacterium sp.]